jgi:hypothetical protein
MQMVRQNNNGLDPERGACLRRAKRCAHRVNAINACSAAAVGQRNGDKIRATWEKVPPMAHHGACPSGNIIFSRTCMMGKVVNDLTLPSP